MKPKRIKAEHGLRLGDGGKYERLYILRQSEIRALAEQIDRDYHEDPNWGYPRTSMDSVLRALKRAGITPGKERAK